MGSVIKVSKTLKDGTIATYWLLKYTLPNGKIKKEQLGSTKKVTKSYARQVLQQREEDIRNKKYNIVPTISPKVSVYAEQYIEDKKKRIRSIRDSRMAIELFSKMYGEKKLKDISEKDIEAFVLSRLETVTPSSVRRQLAVIRNLYTYAILDRVYTGDNPVSVFYANEAKRGGNSLVQMNEKEILPLTKQEIDALLLACDFSENPNLKDVIELGMNVLFRPGEVFGLRWEYIKGDIKYIELPRTDTKQQKVKRTPINKVVKEVLERRKERTYDSGFVFPSNPKNGKISASGHIEGLRKPFDKAKEHARITREDVTLTVVMRHTPGTVLIEAGVPLVLVSKLMGHSSTKVTEKYYIRPDKSLFETVDKLESEGLLLVPPDNKQVETVN